MLVLANMALCVVTWRGSRKQSEDMREAISVSRLTAGAADQSASAANKSVEIAARQRREALERETNIVAYRVAVTAERVRQLAESVCPARTTLMALSGRTVSGDDPHKVKADERRVRAKEIMDAANKIIFSELAKISDEEMAIELRSMDGLLVQLEAMKEAISEELDSIAAERRENREQQTALRTAITAAGGRAPPPV